MSSPNKTEIQPSVNSEAGLIEKDNEIELESISSKKFQEVKALGSSKFVESNKAAELYTYGVTPNFYGDLVGLYQSERPTNKRKSMRYTWPTFFPIAFGLQFKKLVNIFYIITGILNFFPQIAVNSPIAVLGPTFCIMLLGVTKEFVGELKRYKEDKIVNATKVQRLALPGSKAYQGVKQNEAEFEVTVLSEIKVGDILKIDDQEQVPADCILLKVKDNKDECFVKTAALDGERNLKPKLANPIISEQFENLFGPQASQTKANVTVNCIEPVKELYYFEGRLKACLAQDPEFKMKLDLNQFMHRGSYVENSGFVYAMVVYTGTESKLIMNLGKYVFKMSSFEKILNRIMVLNLLLAIFIALMTAIVAVVFNSNHESHEYLFYDYDKSGEYFIAFFRVYLIVNSFVPLDLLAMLELSKIMISPMMEYDTEMMVVDTDLKEPVGFKANTLNLAEELGQVEYIFCDKTGTLTQNELVFRGLTLQKGQHKEFHDDDAVKNMRSMFENLNLPQSEQDTFKNFERCINICHDCISLKNEKEGKENELVFNGPSVDEVCLLDMARDTGMSKFISRDADSVKIEIDGSIEQYEVIKIFPFTSERKAMSIVVKHPTEPKAICYVKGADSSVFPMCLDYAGQGKLSGLGDPNGPNNQILVIEQKVEAMAAKGLRTLLYGMKLIEWDGSRDPLDLPLEEIECELEVLAATGVEDLLQENVKECIEDFRDAGISVWMLTGDKGLTAKEIGVSCGLIPPEQPDSPAETLQNNLGTEQNVNDTQKKEPTSGQKVMMFEDTDTVATELYEKIKKFLSESQNCPCYQILISGMVIAVALDNEFTHPELGLLLKNSQSVIVYRSSPAQKAEVVTFMKKFTSGKVTLAIGDGANDVNMIQSADLGFGLMGKEGNQAAAFADYAIPRFKDLRRALFWHGRGYGWRIQYFTIMVLVKSIINAVAKFGVQFTNGASGLQPVDDLLITGFNILMTNWFVVFYSVFDQEVSFKDYGTIEKEKKLPFKMAELFAYTRKFINRSRFLKLIFLVNIYSIACGILIWIVWDQNDRNYMMDSNGQLPGVYSYGVFITMCVVISHHCMVAMNTRNWGTFLTGWACFSISMLPFTLWLAQILKKSATYRSTYRHILSNPTFWMMVLVTAFLIVLPLYVNKRFLQVVRYPRFYCYDSK